MKPLFMEKQSHSGIFKSFWSESLLCVRFVCLFVCLLCLYISFGTTPVDITGYFQCSDSSPLCACVISKDTNISKCGAVNGGALLANSLLLLLRRRIKKRVRLGDTSKSYLCVTDWVAEQQLAQCKHSALLWASVHTITIRASTVSHTSVL